MRHDVAPLLLVALAACSSSQDETPQAGETGGTGTGGGPAVRDAGSGGAHVDSGSGGARVDSGSGGTSGDAAAVDTGSVVPVGCDTADAAAGIWQDVTPPEFLNPSNLEPWGVAVNPQDGTVFAGAGNITNGCGGSGQPACIATGIYRSTDCGATWTLVSTGRSSANLKTGDPWAIRVDPVHPQTMYVNNGYGNNPTLYKSTNGGVDWDPLVPDPENVLGGHNNFVQAVAMDPARPEHLVVTFHDNCGAPYNANCLSETTDGGATWRVFSGPAELTGWGEAASVTIFSDKGFLYGSPQGWGGFYTGDAGQTWTKVLTGPMYGSYGGGARIARDGTAYVGVANTGVFYSSNLGASWTQIAGSPQASVVCDDGVNLYANYGWDSSSRPYYFAPLAGLTTASPPKWTNMASSGITGANMLEYDPTHHLLYAASPGSGIWRLATP
jgi:hypothetical protein